MDFTYNPVNLYYIIIFFLIFYISTMIFYKALNDLASTNPYHFDRITKYSI